MTMNYNCEVTLMEKLDFEWKIELSELSSRECCTLRSKVFSGDKANYQWTLKLDLVVRQDLSSYYTQNQSDVRFKVGVSLSLNSSPKEDIYTMFEIMSNDNEQNARTGSNALVFSNKVLDSPSYCLFDSFKKSSSLQISIALKVQIPVKSGEHNAILVHRLIKPHMKFLKDFEGLLEDNKHSDYVISVGDGSIRCHKSILSCRSLYFKSLFESGLKESVENSIKIMDFSETVIRAMINFFYTAELEKMDIESLLELLKASDFYQVSDLKTVCENFLIELIDTSNACNILLCADASNGEKLKNTSIEFISRNLSSIKESCYDLIESQCPYLLKELILAIAALKNRMYI